MNPSLLSQSFSRHDHLTVKTPVEPTQSSCMLDTNPSVSLHRDQNRHICLDITELTRILHFGGL